MLNVSNYKIEIFTIDEFADFFYNHFAPPEIYHDTTVYDLKAKFEYFDWDDFSPMWAPKKYIDACRFIVAYNHKDILGICKFSYYEFDKHYAVSYTSTNKDYYNQGIATNLNNVLFKYFSETYPNEILYLSGYSIKGWKFLRSSILKLSQQYHVKIKEKPIQYDFSWNNDEDIVTKSQEEIKKIYGTLESYHQYLCEEFLGIEDREGFKNVDEPTNFYKNPNSIKNMQGDIRGISDKEGDLYVCDNANYLHGSIGKWLKENNFLKWNNDTRIYDPAKNFDVLLWTRWEKTNKFYLSDSSETYLQTIIEYELEDFLPKLRKMYSRLKKKNPQYEFYFGYSPGSTLHVDKIIKRQE